MVVRIDDVSMNTDFQDLGYSLKFLSKTFDEIILGVNIFSQQSLNEALYPELPLRGHDKGYFYHINQILNLEILHNSLDLPSLLCNVTIVSHGLIHTLHNQLSRDAIEMSILSSCSLLKTNKFIPPFNEVNQNVMDVCEKNGIEIIGNNVGRNWRSLELDCFDSSSRFWYFHPWRLKYDELIKRFQLEAIRVS